MAVLSVRSMISGWVFLALVGIGSLSLGDGSRITSLERYGLGGHIQAIGVHHGFHIETVAVDSPASHDQLKAHDVIVKIDGDVVRNLDHLRAVLAEAYVDDADVTLTYLRGTSLTHHVLKCHIKPEAAKSVAKKRRSDAEGDGTR